MAEAVRNDFFLFIKSELIPFDIFPSSEGRAKRVIAAGGNNGNNTNRLLREQEHSGPQICPLEGKRVGQLLLLAFPLRGIHRITRGLGWKIPKDPKDP